MKRKLTLDIFSETKIILNNFEIKLKNNIWNIRIAKFLCLLICVNSKMVKSKNLEINVFVTNS